VSFVLLVVLGAALLAVTMLINPRSTEPPTAGTAPEGTPGPGAPSPAAPAGEAPPAPPASEPAADTSAVPAPAVPPAPPAPVRPAGESIPAAIATLAADVASPYRLVARTTEPTWIRVRTGDGRSSEETLAAGEMREWVSEQPFVLTVGNAGGVSLELNGRMLPPLGARGAVIPRLVLPPR
jgi:cytoskeleton protein RodZ